MGMLLLRRLLGEGVPKSGKGIGHGWMDVGWWHYVVLATVSLLSVTIKREANVLLDNLGLVHFNPCQECIFMEYDQAAKHVSKPQGGNMLSDVFQKRTLCRNNF
jgi:hypothetical protein